MKKRFDFKDEIFKIAEMLEPTNARSMACRSLNQLFKRFPQLKDSCDPVAAENEWKNQALLGTDAFYSCGCKTESEIAALGVEAYWCHLLNLRNSAGLLCYPNLRTCISLLFCLPRTKQYLGVAHLVAERRVTTWRDRTSESNDEK